MMKRLLMLICAVLLLSAVTFCVYSQGRKTDREAWLDDILARDRWNCKLPIIPPEEVYALNRIRRAGITKDARKLERIQPSLDGPNFIYARTTALALGRIGDEGGLKHLQRAEQKWGRTAYRQYAIPAIRVARARIVAQRASGLARIAKFEQELGLDHDDLAWLSRSLPERRYGNTPAGLEELAIWTIAEMLSESKAKGIDVQALAKGFKFRLVDEKRLELAGRPQAERVSVLIAYVSCLRILTKHDYAVGALLADEGEAATHAMTAALARAVSGDADLLKGYRLLARSLAARGEPGDTAASLRRAVAATLHGVPPSDKQRRHLEWVESQFEQPLLVIE